MKNILLTIIPVFLSIAAIGQGIVPNNASFQFLQNTLRITSDGVYQENPLLFPGPIDIVAGDIDIPQGATGCMDVTASNFQDILIMEFSCSWNFNNFQFTEVTNINLPGMTQGDFSASNGLLTVEFEDASGVSVPDNTVLFSICFEAIGSVGANSTFAFVPIPTNIYVTDTSSGGSHVGMNSTNGTLTITQPIEPLVIISADITDIDCSNEGEGAIDLSIDGGIAPYNFSWSNSATTEDLSSLDPGMYTVTITDSNSPADELIMMYTVNGDTTPPTADAGATMTLDCSSTSVSLDGSASSSGGSFNYLWTTMDGTIVSGETTLTPEVGTAGTYELLVTNSSNSCTATADVAVMASTDLPSLDLANSATMTCLTNTIVLDASGSESGATIEYLWSTTDGSIVAGETTTMLEIDAVGTYQFVVTNTQNGCSSSSEVTVDAPVIPEAIVPAELTIDCAPELMIDGSMSTMGDDISYDWSTADGQIISGETTPNLVIGSAGAYELFVTNNTNGCSANASTTVISNPDNPNVMVVLEATITCDSSTILLDGTGSDVGDQFTYQWSTLDGTIDSGDTTLMPQVSSPGRYDLIVSNNDNQCTALATVEVIENTTPPTADAGASQELSCDGLGVTLGGSTTSMGATFSYQWASMDGVIASGETTAMAQVEVAGTYALTVTDTSNGCTATDSVEITPNMNAPDANAGDNMSIACGGQTTQLDGSNSASGDNYTYQWTSSDGNIVSGANTTMPQVDMFGTYQLIVTDLDNSCTGSSTVMVVLDESLPLPFAGDDASNCSDSLTIAATAASNGITGMWSADYNTITFNNSSSNETMVSNLIPGENYLYWSLSTEDCANYAVDTVIIYNEGEPNANDDVEFTIVGAQALQISVLDNDLLTAVEDFTLNVIETPTDVGFMDLGDGLFEFAIPGGYLGSTQAMYELCNMTCMTCDTALASVVVERPPSADGTFEVYYTNAITPNGDGRNDIFYVDELDFNRDAYPNNELVVFNRWGNVVYQTKPYNNDWEGTNKSGGKLPPGTYYFVLRLDINTSKIVKGDITIIR